MTLKEMLELRAKAAVEIRRMADLINKENRDFTAEETPAWDKVNAEYDSLSGRIERQERAAKIEKEQADPQGDPAVGRGDSRGNARDRQEASAGPTESEKRARAISSWLRASCGKEVADEDRANAKACGVNLAAKELDIALRRDIPQMRREYRDLSSAIGPSGAYMIAPLFVNTIEMSLLAFGGMRRTSTILRTATGAQLPYPTCNDTGNVGALIGENTAVSEQDVSLGVVNLQAYKYTSKMVQVPTELLEDSAFDLSAWLAPVLAERIARIQNTHFTTGDGASKPNGIVTAASSGKTAASASAITFDEVIELFHSVDPAYRDLPGAAWMFNDGTLKALRKLKDGNGNFLWYSGLDRGEMMQGGPPPSILGKPYTVNQDMAAIASSAKTMLFGALSKYIIRDVASVRIMRLVERYAEYDQQAFVMWMRSDGNLLDSGTDPVKYLQQAP